MKTTSVFRNPDPFLISYGFSADVKELNRSKRTAAWVSLPYVGCTLTEHYFCMLYRSAVPSGSGKGVFARCADDMREWQLPVKFRRRKRGPKTKHLTGQYSPNFTSPSIIVDHHFILLYIIKVQGSSKIHQNFC